MEFINPLSAKKSPKWKWLHVSRCLAFPYNFSISLTCFCWPRNYFLRSLFFARI